MTTHVRPDGDGLGSELALHRYFKRIGKKSRIINVSKAPDNLHFLYKAGEVEVYQPKKHDSAIHDADFIIALDIGGMNKIGTMQTPVKACSGELILIDHHVKRGRDFDYYFVDENASSSGEMVYRFLQAANIKPFRKEWADPLYVAVNHDTGNFSYDRTTADTFRMAAHMVDSGTRPYDIFKNMQCSRSLGQLHLSSKVLAKTELTARNRIAWASMTLSMIKKYGVDSDNIPRVIDQVLRIRGIEIAILFIEMERRKIKVSLRSKTYVDVSRFARTFEGGGHRKSAGFTAYDTLANTRSRVLASARRLIRS